MAYDGDFKNAQETDETISLLDLIVVLLKRRRLIIVSTLAAMAFAAVAYFIYPPIKVASAERDRIVEVSTNFMLGASMRSVVSDIESTNYIVQSFNDPATILAALRTAGYEKLEKASLVDGTDEDNALYTVRRRLIENKGVDGSVLKEALRTYSVRTDKGMFIVSFKNGDSDKAKAFLSTLIEKVQADLSQFARPFAEKSIESYERLLAVQNPTDAVESSIAQGYKDYAMARSLLDGTSSPLTTLRAPYAFIPKISILVIRKDILKKGILLVLGVFFMSVFAAFVLHYIDSVRKDPESMEKIREALGKSL